MIVFSRPAGSAIGLEVPNGSLANIIVVGNSKSAQSASDRTQGISNGESGPGSSANTINEYLSGLGIITNIKGSFADSIEKRNGVNVQASVDGTLNQMWVQGVAFQQVVAPSNGIGQCSPVEGHGIAKMLRYFQDNRLSTTRGTVVTTVSLGDVVLRGAVTGLEFSVVDEQYSIWGWTIHLLLSAYIEAGKSKNGSL